MLPLFQLMVEWQDSTFRRKLMLYWTIVFLVVALIAGVLGFTGVAVAAAGLRN